MQSTFFSGVSCRPSSEEIEFLIKVLIFGKAMTPVDTVKVKNIISNLEVSRYTFWAWRYKKFTLPLN